MLRSKGKVRSTLAVVVPAALLAAGLMAAPLLSTEWSWRTPFLSEVSELSSVEPVRALPRTEAVLAVAEAQRYLRTGRPYAAWEALLGHLALEGTVGSAANILAARAAAEWGGWNEVKDLLEGKAWLESASDGDGLLLLARAEEETGNPVTAMGLYRRYVALPSASAKGLANARLARLHSRREEHAEAARVYAAAAAELPEIADWMQAMQVEQLAEAGDPTVTRIATRMTGGSAPVRERRVRMEASAWVLGAETEKAISRLNWEGRILNASGSRTEAARLDLERAHLLLGSSRPSEGRQLLTAVAHDEGVSGAVRLEAARMLDELEDLALAEELAAVAGYEAGNRPGLAARSLRAAFELGAPDDGMQRLRLARLLYDARDYGPASTAFRRAAEMLDDRELRAEAELYEARSLYRNGRPAIAEFREVAETYEGTAAAGTALFILGDEASTTQAGLAYYRRAAAIPSSPDAREALDRVGDRSLRLGDTAGAIRAWEEYVGRYPKGSETARVAYQVGKLHASAGREDRAREMFTAAVRAEPTSYYAVRAAERLGVNPLDHVLAEPRPWIGLASEPGDAAEVLRRMDLLRDVGLEEERDAELEAALREFADKPLALISLAEGLRDRNEPVAAINIGRNLLPLRDGEWDDRLLRVVFPFPYREMVEAEARRAGVDPILYAALIRQESSFRADAKSWVGATGLGQIMPATGRWLAPTVGIRNYRQSLLEVPEVNLRMGTKYLADLVRRYDGAADLALAGYNAGPGRADRWRRTLGYGRDTDAFRAAIPFDETRNYVMLVLRNRAMYDRLYGE